MLYTRYGNTPNALVVQRRIAMLEGAEAALVLSSGMAATSCTMLSLLRPGDHLVTSSWIYGGTRKLFDQELPAMGVTVTLVDPTESRGWRRAMQRNNTRDFSGVAGESRPRACSTFARSRALAREHGLALVVDATFASPINFRPLEHGADVVIHSATKYLNGHHDVLAGVVSGTESMVDEVRAKMMVWGQAPDPFALWLLERGLKTLDVRVQRQNEIGHAHRAVGGDASGNRARALSRTRRRIRITRSPARRSTALAACWPSSCAVAATRQPRVLERLRLFTHAPQPRRRRFARERAALHVARAHDAASSARRSAFRMDSCDSASGSRTPTT